ncbi:TRAP transporter small permease [Roseateles toxinivorans]|uniref:TRAP transporter small permease protein n=1 Tax=Roseateles toxinivorans TaxID=270368 RepID=A0A4R6QTR7_9BURK|nr:TRAP transporter small permease [Roseateles toxinivorans]TDP74974.1 TRAP-type C4-dicarboxylate transport system permease small subunit [Roseateles toxinivorans]
MTQVATSAPPTAARRLLDGLFDVTAALGALCMIALLLMVLLSVVQRQLSFHVPGTDAYAGYLMAGAGFLALAHTLKRGEHIRVTLILGLLHGRTQRALELFSLTVASVLAIAMAWFSARLVYQSWTFHDISTLSDGTPLWLPQLSMAIGTLVLAIAFVDELQLEWRGLRAVASSEEALHNE